MILLVHTFLELSLTEVQSKAPILTLAKCTTMRLDIDPLLYLIFLVNYANVWQQNMFLKKAVLKRVKIYIKNPLADQIKLRLKLKLDCFVIKTPYLQTGCPVLLHISTRQCNAFALPHVGAMTKCLQSEWWSCYGGFTAN